MTLGEFYERAVAFCKDTNASMTSAYRTVKHNAEVGGILASWHLKGLAIDVVYDSPLPLQSVKETAQLLQLAVFRESDHDHLLPIPEELPLPTPPPQPPDPESV